MKFLEGLRGGGRVLGNVANEPYRPQAPRGRHTGRGATSTQSTHGRTTKKNSGSSTPIATDPIYIPFFQSLHRSRPPTALEKKMKRKRVDEPNDRTTARSRNLASVPRARREALYQTPRARRRRPGRIQSSVQCNRRLLRHKVHCSSERERPSVRAARRLCAAACVSWVPEAQQRWRAGRSTTRTASFMINCTRE